jgi:hypothetical protein
LRRLGLELRPQQTPGERALLLAANHPSLAENSGRVIAAYATERFGGFRADQRELNQAWRSLRRGLWVAWLRRWLPGRREVREVRNSYPSTDPGGPT